jgi:hypothetical protein
MFRRMFGGDAKGGQAVSQSSANKTVDAIQKLGEVLQCHRCPSMCLWSIWPQGAGSWSRQHLIPVDTSTVRHCRQKSFW